MRALQFRGALLVETGDDRGLEDLRDALDLALERGIADEAPIAWGNLAYQLWLRDGPRAALSVWRECGDFSSERGYSAHYRWSQAGQLECLYDLLEWDAGLEIARDMARWDDERGVSQIGLYARTFEVSVLTMRMQADQAWTKVQELLPLARTSGIPEHAAMAALGAVDRSDPLMITQDAVSSPRHRLSIATAVGMRALAVGDIDDALRTLEDAVARWSAMDVPVEEALVSMAFGQTLALAGRANDAFEVFARARRLLRSGGAAWPLQVLDGIGAAAREGRSHELTPYDPNR
ncbi:MAG: hypothetical protein WEA10_09495 [Actinomycetota bacterium]